MLEHCVLCGIGLIERRDIHFINIGGYTWLATVGPLCEKCRDGLKNREVKKELIKVK